MKIRFLIFLISILFNHSIFAQAQTTPPIDSNKVFYSAGIGLGFIPEYEGASAPLILPSLMFNAQKMNGQYLRWTGLNLEINVLKSKQWELGPKANLKIWRTDEVDNEFIARMEEIDPAFFVGAFTRYKYKKFDIKAEYSQDVSGVNDGGIAALDLGYNFRKGKFLHRFSVQSSYATENYMQTYFGVDNENVGESDLPYYSIEGGIKDIGTTLRSTYPLSQKWMLTGIISFRQFLGDVEDSPIVEQGTASQFSGGLILIRRF